MSLHPLVGAEHNVTPISMVVFTLCVLFLENYLEYWRVHIWYGQTSLAASLMTE